MYIDLDCNIQFQITHMCDMKPMCRHCWVDFEGSMTLKSLEQYLECICDSDINVVDWIMSGGEPFSHPDIIKMIRLMLSYTSSVTILTNGNWIFDERYKMVRKAFPDHYDQIKFQISNDLFHQETRPWRLKYVYQKLDEYWEWQTSGYNMSQYNWTDFVYPFGKAKHLLTSSKLDEDAACSTTGIFPRPPSFAIAPDHNLYACCFQRLPIGHMLDESFAELVRNALHERRIRLIRDVTRQACVTCPSHKGVDTRDNSRI